MFTQFLGHTNNRETPPFILRTTSHSRKKHRLNLFEEKNQTPVLQKTNPFEPNQSSTPNHEKINHMEFPNFAWRISWVNKNNKTGSENLLTAHSSLSDWNSEIARIPHHPTTTKHQFKQEFLSILRHILILSIQHSNQYTKKISNKKTQLTPNKKNRERRQNENVINRDDNNQNIANGAISTSKIQ